MVESEMTGVWGRDMGLVLAETGEPGLEDEID